MPLVDSLDPSIAFLKFAARAYPDQNALQNLSFEGNLVQAWQVVARLLAVEEETLAKKLAPLYGVGAAGAMDHIQSSALAAIPSAFCQRHRILPLKYKDGTLLVATANPADANLTERVRFVLGHPFEWVLAPPEAIETATIVALSQEAARQVAGDSLEKNLSVAGVDNAIVKLGHGLMVAAIEQRASDLHIQPFMGAATVRIRVDGVMRRQMTLSDAVSATLIRHFKTRSGMDSTNTMIPQDGRMSTVVNQREFDMRVSVLPVRQGERLVIRFLEQGKVQRLSGAGFSLAALQTLRRSVRRPSGLVLITGPTGSGKTSTLYAMLSEVNNSAINIITVENPVEYRIPGISQVDVNEKAGRTFATSLRSILRQDPDVVLIGEIRDHETAEIALQASLTGHLVLSTLHTNDALTAIPRLLDLGVQTSMLADSLAVVASQRLCRKLCVSCRLPVSDPLTNEERLFTEITGSRPVYRPVGCKLCAFTGFFGRLPIVDIVEITPGLRDAIAKGETRISELEKLRESGLKSLAASGSMRVISGDTTVREIHDTIGQSFWAELAQIFEKQGHVSESDAEDLSASYIGMESGILLITGEPHLGELLRQPLEDQGYRLTVAINGVEASRCLQKDEEIVFTVLDVPDALDIDGGAKFIADARSKIAWARLPAACMVIADIAAQRESLLKAGLISKLISKPMNPDELLRVIHQSESI
jgi:type II secretory ATPase GspE/PulE/Tfp pilus assembly ATPase PilB-like protein